MNVVVIGSGGREHALVDKINESSKLENLFIIPGNPGTEEIGKNIELNFDDHNVISKFCEDNNIDLVVIGPEQPLVNGLADHLRSNNINVFGPNKDAAMIEGDKSFSKNLMKKYNIPTAEYKVFDNEHYHDCLAYLDKIVYPTVIKASGLAAGKGVAICENKIDAVEYVNKCFNEGLFGDSGTTLVIEKFMNGQEVSIFAITDGKEYVILPSSQDHKRAYDGDKGPNTGGMGAYAPAPLVDDILLERIKKEIIEPTISALNTEGKKYNGCLYAGLMITESGPQVVEFNCRFGDPETQVVLPIIDGDFLELLYSTAIGKIDTNATNASGACAICVVAASEGYPGKYEKGKEITGIDQIIEDDIKVFQAGTKNEDGILRTSGGRVLGVTAIVRNNNLKKCKTKAYDALTKINFKGIIFRKDISDKAFL